MKKKKAYTAALRHCQSAGDCRLVSVGKITEDLPLGFYRFSLQCKSTNFLGSLSFRVFMLILGYDPDMRGVSL
jgi:hypothetical protein